MLCTMGRASRRKRITTRHPDPDTRAGPHPLCVICGEPVLPGEPQHTSSISGTTAHLTCVLGVPRDWRPE